MSRSSWLSALAGWLTKRGDRHFVCLGHVLGALPVLGRDTNALATLQSAILGKHILSAKVESPEKSEQEAAASSLGARTPPTRVMGAN